MRTAIKIGIVVFVWILALSSSSFGAKFFLTDGKVITGKLLSFDGRIFQVLSDQGVIRIDIWYVGRIEGDPNQGRVRIVKQTPYTSPPPDQITGTLEYGREGELHIRTDYGYLIITDLDKVVGIDLAPLPTPTPAPTPTPRRLTIVNLRKRPVWFDSESQIIQMLKATGLSYPKANVIGTFQPYYEVQTLSKTRKLVIERNSWLMWQHTGSDTPMNWAEAQNYINYLNVTQYAGFFNWRLPTVEELASLFEPQKQESGLYINPAFELKSDVYWSSDQEPKRGFWWGIKYSSGAVSQACSKVYKCYVLPVRSLP